MKIVDIVKLVFQVLGIIMELYKAWKKQEVIVPEISVPGTAKDVMTQVKKNGFDAQAKTLVYQQTGIELTPQQLEVIRDKVDAKLNPKRKFAGGQKP